MYKSYLEARNLHLEAHTEYQISYSRASELFKIELVKEGLDAKDCLRSGGATTAAALGIPDRLRQRQGGWRTAKAKNNYIDEKKQKNSLLHITKIMKA
jgi:hypothetical protein